MEMLSVCVGLQNEMHMFRENIFCLSLRAKSQKKSNLPERPLAKLQPFFVDVAIIVLTQQINLF